MPRTNLAYGWIHGLVWLGCPFTASDQSAPSGIWTGRLEMLMEEDTGQGNEGKQRLKCETVEKRSTEDK